LNNLFQQILKFWSCIWFWWCWTSF